MSDGGKSVEAWALVRPDGTMLIDTADDREVAQIKLEGHAEDDLAVPVAKRMPLRLARVVVLGDGEAAR